MAHVLFLVLAIGIVDSLNPSTIAPALYLAAGRSPHKSLLGFIAGVLAVNLLGGLLLTLGPGQAILALAPHPGREVRHLLELGFGLATLLVAIGLWLARSRLQRHALGTEQRIDRSSLLVGAGITAAELPTALPYFAAIAAIVSAGPALTTQVALVGVFNAAFVAPLLAIAVLRRVAGVRALRTIERLRAGLDRHLATAIPALVLLVAVVLTLVGTVGLLRR